MTAEKLKGLIKEIDKNKNGAIDLEEFLSLYTTQDFKDGGKKQLQQAVGERKTQEGKSGALHSYSEPEVRAFSQYINENLAGDADCQKYLKLEGEDIFTKTKD